jgi:uncharacterized protein (TIGR00725 family)
LKANIGAKPLIVGVMGGGEVSAEAAAAAYRLGGLIAREGWVLLNGGRNAGIMEASARGAREQGGLTVGILPDEDRRRMSSHILIPIVTGMGNARNCINVLSSHVVVACRGEAGTLSEIALALKCAKPVILLNFNPGAEFDRYRRQGLLHEAASPEAAITLIKQLAGTGGHTQREDPCPGD